jgi:hypothetical protein
MLTLHLEHQGKTAKVSLHALPPARPKQALSARTSKGPVTSLKIRNGLNLKVKPASLTAQDLIAGDPELELKGAGQTIFSEDLTAAWFDPAAPEPRPIGDFREVDIIFGADGQEKERRPHLSRKRNLDELHPVKSGKRLPLVATLTGFVFKSSLQIVHEDGVTRDFLYNIAKDLHDKQEMVMVGAGPKGNLPLVVRDDGTPYRGFLYGTISPDQENYQLLLLLSDQELKLPQPSPAAAV